MEIKMGYPSIETIEAFKQIVEKDGLEEILGHIVTVSGKNKKIAPIVSFLKEMIFSMINENLEEEMSAYTNGFISCLDLFRRQIESESISLDDVNLQLENIAGWNQYLEEEVTRLKEEVDGLKRRNKELSEVPALPTNGNVPNTT